MRRLAILLLTCILFFVAVAPSLYLLQFQLRKAYIERELCVQRNVMAEMRTCHGECQLSKKFRALEQEAAKDFPAERIEFQASPIVVHAPSIQVPFAGSSDRCFPRFDASLVPGHRSPTEPVPWC